MIVLLPEAILVILTLPICVSCSAIAPPTVEAVVPIAPAVIVPNSASNSLTAEVSVVPVVVRELLPCNASNSLIASVKSVAVVVSDMSPISTSCSLIEPTKSFAVVFNV